MILKKDSWSYINIHVSAFRFFYGITLRRNLNNFVIPCPKMIKKLPPFLSRDEVRRLFDVMSGMPRQLAFFNILYGCGLRGEEACYLRICDIDWGNKTLWVRNGKGGKERGVYLPKRVYVSLRRYYKAFHFENYIFPGYADPSKPMDPERARQWLKEAKAMTGIRKQGALHMWRHSYATHALEDGKDLGVSKKIWVIPA
jgi:integrase/recombinase XerD